MVIFAVRSAENLPRGAVFGTSFIAEENHMQLATIGCGSASVLAILRLAKALHR